MPSKNQEKRPLPLYERMIKAGVVAPPFVSEVVKLAQPPNATKFGWGCECHVKDQAGRPILKLSRGPVEQLLAMEVCTWTETFAAGLDLGMNLIKKEAALQRIGTGAFRLIEGPFDEWEKNLLFDLCDDLVGGDSFVKIGNVAPDLEVRFSVSWPNEHFYTLVFAAKETIDHLRPLLSR